MRVCTYCTTVLPRHDHEKNLRTGSINVYYACEEIYLISRLEKVISAQLCADDTLLTLIMK